MTLHSQNYLEGLTIGDTRYGRESGGYPWNIKFGEDKSYES